MPENYSVGTGAHLSPPEPTAWTLASAGAPTTYPKSRFIDISWMRASMQGKIGCCVGCSGEEAVRQIIFLLTGKQCNPNTPDELSFRFIYALAKGLDGVADEGTFPALVANIVRKFGVPLAKYCPNDVTLTHEAFVYNRKMKDKDSIIAILGQEAYDDAQSRRAGANLTEPVSLDGLKKAINYAADNKGGVMILRRVGDTYWTGKDGIATWDKEKLLPIRVPKVFTSGHEEFLYGYDEEPETGRVRLYWLNHWSEKWADNGRGWEYADEWLPYIGELRVVVAEVPVVTDFRYTFTKTMARGAKGADVLALQHILKLENCYPIGTPFTGYFWDKTFAGVVQFQEKYASDILAPLGLTHGTGIVGKATLKKLNELYQVTN